MRFLFLVLGGAHVECVYRSDPRVSLYLYCVLQIAETQLYKADSESQLMHRPSATTLYNTA